jgi:CheY-like chemotaxis protein
MPNRTYFERAHKNIYGKPLIMIVEDNLAIRTLVSTCFQMNGCIINDFENGMEAHRILAMNYGAKKKNSRLKNPYSLILSDIDMPEMNGISLAREAAILAPEVPFTLMTGRPQGPYPKNVREVIHKPFRFKTYERLLNQYVYNISSQ